MKQFRLTFHRLMTHASRNIMLFSLFIVGLILSLLSFVYFYGNMVPYKIDEYSHSLSYRQFLLEFPENTYLSEETIRIFSDNEIQDIRVTCQADIQGLDYSNLLIAVTPKLNCMLNGNNGNIVYFDLFDESNSLLDSAILSKDFGLLEEILIDGYPFSVVKQLGNASNDIIYIPPSAYFSKNFPIESITYTFYQRISVDEEKTISYQLQDAFPNAVLKLLPSHFVVAENEESVTVIGAISLMYMVSLLSFLFLFKNLLEESSYEDSIFMVAGASRRKVVLVILTELACVTLVASCFVSLVHALTYEAVFIPLNTYENIRYHFSDYLFIAALSLVLSLLISLPFIFTYTRKTIIELKNQYEE